MLIPFRPRQPTGVEAYPVLPRRQTILILAVAVVHFLIGSGPVWQHPWDLDRSILYSYIPIPFLVLAALAWKRRLALRAWFLHTLEIACAKLIVTASILLCIWGAALMWPPKATRPEPVAAPAPPTPTPAPRPVVAPSIIPPESTGTLSGTVRLGDQPVAGALVFVSGGLERFTFAAPERPLELVNDGTGLSPGLAGVQVGQPLTVRSANRRLHSLLAVQRDRSWLVNVAVLGSGEGRTFSFSEPHGLVELRCTVHPSRERSGYLAILAHPFFTRTGEDGRFRLQGVPQGRLTLSAFHPQRGSASRVVNPLPREETDVGLALTPEGHHGMD